MIVPLGARLESSARSHSGGENMLFCWLLLIAFLSSFAFAVEPHISSIAALPSQDTLLAGSARSRTPIVPVSEPIVFVPATATAPLFGVLARKLLRSEKQ